MRSTQTQRKFCTATAISSLCSVFIFLFCYCLLQWPHLLEAKSRTGNHASSGMINTYGIHYWRKFRNSYKKLAWVGFEPMNTEFRSDALGNWAIRPCVQLALRANFVQLLQVHLFVECSHFILAIAFFSRHICFKRKLAQAIMLVAEWLIHMLFTTEVYIYTASVSLMPTLNNVLANSFV